MASPFLRSNHTTPSHKTQYFFFNTIYFQKQNANRVLLLPNWDLHPAAKPVIRVLVGQVFASPVWSANI
jgi:hypothetical protein